MAKFVIKRYPNAKYHTPSKKWKVVLDLDLRTLEAGSVPLTDKAISHWKETKNNIGYALFNGLSIHDIKSIASATKANQASLNIEQMGMVAFYKIGKTIY